MYLAHFGLSEAPFSITPDTRFLYLSERHRDALAHLLYGIGEGGGFVQLTGEVGTGKTTLCRRFLEQTPSHVDVALILNPRLTGPELLAAICDELRVPYPSVASVKALVDALSRHLLDAHARGRRTVLVIDEAQDLAPEVLEDVRLLTNLETPREKLLQIILIGQPELGRMLDRDDLRQVAQRITARYHLAPFSPRETRAYIRHRLEVAGVKRLVFDEGAMREVHRVSGGVPRLINIVCDRALLGAYAGDRHAVDRRVVRRAAREALAGAGRRPRRARLWLSAAAVAVAVVGGAWVTAWPEWMALVPLRAGGGAPALHLSSGGTPVTSPPAIVTAPLPGGPVALASATPGVAGLAPAAGSADRPAGLRSVGSAAPGLAEALADSTAKDQQSALASLYRLWDADRDRGDVGCDRPGRDGLRCLTSTGGWSRLRRLDTPAMLELATPAGDRRYAALVGLDDDRATLVLGDHRLTVPLAQVDALWAGGFSVLWKPPALAGTILAPGSRGPNVGWLQERLDEISGRPGRAGARDVYDEALKAHVIAFQRRQSLEPDGVVGEDTLLRLVLAGTPRAPRLARAADRDTGRASHGSPAAKVD